MYGPPQRPALSCVGAQRTGCARAPAPGRVAPPCRLPAPAWRRQANREYGHCPEAVASLLSSCRPGRSVSAPAAPLSRCDFRAVYRSKSWECSALSGSRNTSIVPAHDSPSSQASSSPSGNSTRRGTWVVRMASACSMTYASTQPPMVTAPKISPPSPTHIFAPPCAGTFLWY